MAHYSYAGGYSMVTNSIDELYSWILNSCLYIDGIESESRVGKVLQMRLNVDIDTNSGFPIIGLRKLDFDKVVDEFIFDTEGRSTHISGCDKAAPFWKFFTDENGYLGASCYNRYFRRFPNPAMTLEQNERPSSYKPTINQIEKVIKELRGNPFSRRAVIYNGHPGMESIDNFVLPCAPLLVFSPTDNGESLDLQVSNRSLDLIFGFPYDVCRYTLFLLKVAKLVGMRPNRVMFNAVNAHIYKENIDEAKIMEKREPKPGTARVIISNDGSIAEDFELRGYDPYPAMKIKLCKN